MAVAPVVVFGQLGDLISFSCSHLHSLAPRYRREANDDGENGKGQFRSISNSVSSIFLNLLVSRLIIATKL